MSKVFYDHLIMIDDVLIEIDELDVADSEKKQLKKVIDELMHQRVLTLILSVLPREHHELFLADFHAAPYDIGHLHFIQKNVSVDIHQELSHVGKELKKEIREEIKKHKKKSR